MKTQEEMNKKECMCMCHFPSEDIIGLKLLCTHCNPLNTNEREDSKWEERFDLRFVGVESKPHFSDWLTEDNGRIIKSFISDLLKSEEKRVRKEIKDTVLKARRWDMPVNTQEGGTTEVIVIALDDIKKTFEE